MEWLTSPDIWIAFATLLLLEIVLGIDNVVFISILSGKLPADQHGRERTIGLGLALITSCRFSSWTLSSPSTP